MMTSEWYDETITPDNLDQVIWENAHLEYCTIDGVDLQGLSLKNSTFSECRFVNCNLSSVNIGDTRLQSVQIEACKMMGVNFSTCSDLGFKIEAVDSDFSHSIFYQKNLRKCLFADCNFTEADFEEADLSGAILKGSNLLSATFERTNLEGTDLADSYHLLLDPLANRVKGMQVSRDALEGLVKSLGIIVADS